MPRTTFVLVTLFALALASEPYAQSIRDRIRGNRDRSTTVTESQASDLTLTKTAVTVRPIQVWVRTAGAIDKGSRTIRVLLPPSEGALVKAGQRVRAFPPERRSTMYQARVEHVAPPKDGRVAVTVAMIAPPQVGSTWYVMEIVTDRGDFLSVPNEAIIEEGDRHVVYVEEQPGQFVPHEIQIGIQGELYTQVLTGVKDGDSVVTIGSFFIDAEHKLKGTGGISQAATP